jgi:hypothetical protein
MRNCKEKRTIPHGLKMNYSNSSHCRIRVGEGEISTVTIKNYFKHIKRFFEMNRINF